MTTDDACAIWIQKTLRKDSAGAMRRDDARNLLRRTIESAIDRHGLRVHAWAMLPSKVELVIALPTQLPLQQVVGETFCYFTRRFNSRYRRTGPLFRTKFLKRYLLTHDAVRRAVDDVNRAPARRDLVRKPGREPYGSADVYSRGVDDGIVTPFSAWAGGA